MIWEIIIKHRPMLLQLQPPFYYQCIAQFTPLRLLLQLSLKLWRPKLKIIRISGTSKWIPAKKLQHCEIRIPCQITSSLRMKLHLSPELRLITVRTNMMARWLIYWSRGRRNKKNSKCKECNDVDHHILIIIRYFKPCSCYYIPIYN